MKRLFYLLFGLVLLPALLYAQGSLSLKDINDNLTNNYYTKTVSDSKYATSTDISAKADKTYVDANFATTAENALKQNIADMVDYYTKTAADLLLADKADTGAVALKADQTKVDSIEASLLADIVNLATNYWTAATTKAYIDGTDEIQAAAIALKANSADVYDTAAINLLLADKADTGSVAIVSGALAAHTGEVSGAHQGTAIAVDSSGFTGNLKLADDTVQKALATLDALAGLPATNAITKIYGSDDVVGSDTGAVWLVGTNGVTVNRTSNTFEVDIDSATKFDDYYTSAQTNATIEAAIAAIPATDLSDYYTKAQTESTVAVMINDNAQAKYWYANNMVSGDFTGEVLIATVASSQTQYYAVYMSSSGLAAADSDAYATLPALGVILETGTGDKKVLVKGLVRNDSWNWTVGGRVYVSGSAGQLTQTAPTTAGTMINIIGIAVHADILYVCPSTTVVEN